MKITNGEIMDLNVKASISKQTTFVTYWGFLYGSDVV